MQYTYIKYIDTGKIGLLEGLQDTLPKNSYVIIKRDDYIDIAKVIGTSSKLYDVKACSFVREATPQDISKMSYLNELAQNHMKIAKGMALKHNISLKFIKSYIPFDNTKSFFFYTADTRVDFRQFVKDLAKAIKKRIEMRQIGNRDAVQILGSIGICGFKTCCSNFMDSFDTVNLKDLEIQNLPMSPSKFSGPCGKLVCCISFEKLNYIVKHILPPENTNICFAQKEYTIAHIDPIKNTIDLQREGENISINLLEFLPEGYDIVIKKCASCGGCCVRQEEQNVVLEEVLI